LLPIEPLKIMTLGSPMVCAYEWKCIFRTLCEMPAKWLPTNSWAPFGLVQKATWFSNRRA